MRGSEPEPMFGVGMGSAVVYGSAIGILVVFVLYGAIATYAGASFGSAVGIGLFTAFWGGIGFGGMFGAVIRASVITQVEARMARASRGAAEGDHDASIVEAPGGRTVGEVPGGKVDGCEVRTSCDPAELIERPASPSSSSKALVDATTRAAGGVAPSARGQEE